MTTEKRYSVGAAFEGCVFSMLLWFISVVVVIFVADSVFETRAKDAERILLAVLWPIVVGYAGYRATRSRAVGTTNAVVVGIFAMVVIMSRSDRSLPFAASLVTPTIDWIKIAMLGLSVPSAMAGARIRLARDAKAARAAAESVDDVALVERPQRLLEKTDDADKGGEG